ncbi:MAG: RidA family protein [Acidobacteriota bacterium]
MNSRKEIATAKAPVAIGPYAQAVAAGGLIYLSGQVALDPETGELVRGSIEEEAKLTLENLKAVHEAAGSGFDRVLKTTVYLTDFADFQVMNRVYESYFGSCRPARATVQVVGLPKGARIEIEAIAQPRE